MTARRMGISEARRRLPEVVETVATEGGRVDITHRGEPRVSIVRTLDLVSEGPLTMPERLTALHVVFNEPVEDLVNIVRELRSRTGRPRSVGPGGSAPRGRASRRRAKK